MVYAMVLFIYYVLKIIKSETLQRGYDWNVLSIKILAIHVPDSYYNYAYIITIICLFIYKYYITTDDDHNLFWLKVNIIIMMI